MIGKIILDYSATENEFIENLELSVNDQPEFDQVIIENIPTALKGLQLITQIWFESKVCSYEQLIGINLKINGSLNDLPENIEFTSQSRILIVFQSTRDENESKFFWKVAGLQQFYVLNIDNDVTMDITSFCYKFMVDEIKNGRTG